MSVNIVERVLPALAASRFTYTATQVNVHSDAPLRDATVHLACRATCVATHAHTHSLGARHVGAKVMKKRARRALPSRKESGRRTLDEPLTEPGRLRRGITVVLVSSTPHVHFKIGLDRTLQLRHNILLLFSQCTTWQTYLLTSDCYLCNCYLFG